MVYPTGGDVHYTRPDCDLCGETIPRPNAAHMTTVDIAVESEYGELPSLIWEHTGHVCTECDPVDVPSDLPGLAQIEFRYVEKGDQLHLTTARVASSGSYGFWTLTEARAPDEIVELGHRVVRTVTRTEVASSANVLGAKAGSRQNQ